MRDITLGEHTIPVYQQRQAYIVNRLGRFFGRLTSQGEVDADNLWGFVAGNEYDALCALIPNLSGRMPKWEFMGYGSEGAMQENHYSEEADKSPYPSEVKAAFRAVAEENEIGSLIDLLRQWVDPQLLRRYLNAKLAEALTNSRSSPPANGGWARTTSGTPHPISTATTD